MATFSSKHFGYSKMLNLLTVKISMLERIGKVWDRIFPDSDEHGFEIISESTGQASTWFVDRLDIDSEGEIQGWNMKPTAATVQRLPQLKNVRLLVVNT